MRSIIIESSPDNAYHLIIACSLHDSLTMLTSTTTMIHLLSSHLFRRQPMYSSSSIQRMPWNRCMCNAHLARWPLSMETSGHTEQVTFGSSPKVPTAKASPSALGGSAQLPDFSAQACEPRDLCFLVAGSGLRLNRQNSF